MTERFRTYVIRAADSQELLEVVPPSDKKQEFWIRYRHHPSRIQCRKSFTITGDETRILCVGLSDDRRSVVAVVEYAPLRPDRIERALDEVLGEEEREALVENSQDKIQELIKRAKENQDQVPLQSLATCFSVPPEDREEAVRERKRQRETPHFDFK